MIVLLRIDFLYDRMQYRLFIKSLFFYHLQEGRNVIYYMKTRNEKGKE